MVLSLDGCFSFSSRRRQTRCALVTGVQTCALPIVRVAADEIMPVVQGFALGAQAIGAGLRQPFEVVDLRFGQRQAIGNMAAAMLVVAAARGRKIEQAARDIRRIDAARVLILQLEQAAFAAAVAQGLPLTRVEAGERRFPEGLRLGVRRSEEHTSELQSLMRISYAVFCLKKKNTNHTNLKT